MSSNRRKDKEKTFGETMKSFKEYLAEAEKINYDFVNITSLRKRNIRAAREILKNNKEIIQDINNAESIGQFDTEDQRDAVVSAYIIDKEQPEYADSIGLKISNPKNFGMKVKDEIIDPTRHKAQEIGVKNPTISQVKEAPKGDAKETEEPEDKEREELASRAGPSVPEEPETEETPEEPESAKEEPEKSDEGDTPASSSKKPYIDKEDFPDPVGISKQIETLKKDTLEKINQELEDKDLTREKIASLHRVRDGLSTKLNALSNKARKQSSGYSDFPTSSSMRKASTAAKLALNTAETAAQIATSKIERKQLDAAPTRMVKRVAELGQKAGEKLKQAAQSRPAQVLKAEGGRLLKKTGVAAKRGFEKAKEATERVVGRIEQNTTAKVIGQELGSAKAQEYIGHLKNNEEEKAEALMTQAYKVRNEKSRQQKFDKMDKSTDARETRALRRTSSGVGGAKSAAIAKKATDKFRTNQKTKEELDKEKRA